jgi:hypothetical protein
VYRVGTFAENGKRSTVHRTAAQRLPVPMLDPFSRGTVRKGSAEPLRKGENRSVARSSEPSAGLEPATPSLPWQPGNVSGGAAQSQSARIRVGSGSCIRPHSSADSGTLRYRVGTLASRARRGRDGRATLGVPSGGGACTCGAGATAHVEIDSELLGRLRAHHPRARTNERSSRVWRRSSSRLPPGW